MIQSEVKLEPISHTYQDREGNSYTSVTRLLDTIGFKDDWDSIAGKVAGRGKFTGMSKDDVLKAWDENRDKAARHGTRIHNALEKYGQTFSVEEGDRDLEEMVKMVYRDYVDYDLSYDELCLYSKKYMVAGTADKILIPDKKNGLFDVADYKTNISKGIEYCSKDGRMLYAPVDHLSDCNYNKYALQLSIYAYMFECLTGMTCRKMWITFIPPGDYTKFYKIPVVYLKTDAIALLDSFLLKNLIKDSETEIPIF